MKSIKYLVEFLLVKIFYVIFRVLGLKLSSYISGQIFFLYGLFSKRTKIAKLNLKGSFPDLTNKNIDHIVKRMWENFGRNIGEYPNLDRINVLNNKDIQIKNIENLLEPLKNSKNCLFFSAHIGNWELTSHPLTQNGYKINFIYRAPNNKYVDRLLRKIRHSYGVNLIKKGKDGAKDCIKVLSKEGGNIGMLIDQKMNDGIETNFLNRRVMTASAIAKFSLKFKCPIIPAFCIRKNKTKFVIKYMKPIPYEKIKSLKNEEKIMNYLNKIIEEWIIDYPDQWIWFHNR